MSTKISKNENNNIKKNISERYTQNADKKNYYIKRNLLPYKEYKFGANNHNIQRNQKEIKNNKIKQQKANTYSKNIKEISFDKNEAREAKYYTRLKDKLIPKNSNNNNRSEENKNIFSTKYDYILEKGKTTTGPLELPSDIEIQQNLNQKEWNIQKIKINETNVNNVKRSDIIKKIKIFNNKKNNDRCSNLLKKMRSDEKELVIFPYVKEKQKVNKTIHTIGHSNGIVYLKTSVLSGGNENTIYNNFMSKIRSAEKKPKKLKRI
jgi:hypothetical protein